MFASPGNRAAGTRKLPLWLLHLSRKTSGKFAQGGQDPHNHGQCSSRRQQSRSDCVRYSMYHLLSLLHAFLKRSRVPLPHGASQVDLGQCKTSSITNCANASSFQAYRQRLVHMWLGQPQTHNTCCDPHIDSSLTYPQHPKRSDCPTIPMLLLPIAPAIPIIPIVLTTPAVLIAPPHLNFMHL